MSCGCDPGIQWFCGQHKPGSRYRLVQDDSSHWYVIPAEKSEEWSVFEEDEDNWNVPEWATSLNGSPHNVTFSDWRDE